MEGIEVSSAAPAAPGEVFYPSEDGQPVAETQAHILALFTLLATLRQFYAHRPDYFVIGDMFLYWHEGHPEDRKAPDVMLVKGVEYKELRDNFKIWEERATPCVIFEITSPSTADEDVGAKMRVYEQIGVKEYFLFDARHEYLDRQLEGYRLINGRYEALQPSADGCLLSNEMQLLLCPEGYLLALIDFKTGQRVPTPEETTQLWRDAQAEVNRLGKQIETAELRAIDAERGRAEAEHRRLQELQEKLNERRRADEAERQRLAERRRADEAERRAAELAAELARLRPSPPPADTSKDDL